MLYKVFKSIEVTRVGIDIKQISVAVDEPVCGVTVYSEETLYSTLLLAGQVIMYYVVACDIVLLNYIFPALLTAVEGRKLMFSVEASDGVGIIGKGTHVRFIVDIERFMAKLK